MGSEPSGLEEGSGDVVGGVAEAWGGAAGVFESAVDRFGGAVAGAVVVEERGGVIAAFGQGAAGQGAAELAGLDRAGGESDWYSTSNRIFTTSRIAGMSQNSAWTPVWEGV